MGDVINVWSWEHVKERFESKLEAIPSKAEKEHFIRRMHDVAYDQFKSLVRKGDADRCAMRLLDFRDLCREKLKSLEE